MNNIPEFINKFRVLELALFETRHWIWSLRPHQATIGAGILSLKRECATFAELTPEEFTDLGNIIKVIEPTLQQSFGYDVINYLMLMMFDKQVHYHVFPRYENPVENLGEIWSDENWPALPTLLGDPLPDSNLQAIVSLIQSNMPESQGGK